MDRLLKRGRKRLNYVVCFVYVAKCETVEKKHITSSVYDCTVEDVEYHNVSIVTHSHHLVVVITLP